MARCEFLHIASPKSGTSYVQNVLWLNRAATERSENTLPCSGGSAQKSAAAYLLGSSSHSITGQLAEWSDLAPAPAVEQTDEDAIVSQGREAELAELKSRLKKETAALKRVRLASHAAEAGSAPASSPFLAALASNRLACNSRRQAVTNRTTTARSRAAG